MRKIKLYSIVSIDGYASPPDGSVDWITEAKIPHNMEYGIQSFYKGIETVVMTLSHYLNLVSCELLGPHTEKSCIIIRPRADLEVSSRHKVEYITDFQEDFPQTIKHITEQKDAGEGDMWIAGDNRLIRAMLEAGIVDEVIITMIPVSLGRGIKPFPADFNERKWKSVRIAENEHGVTQIHYRSMETTDKNIMN